MITRSYQITGWINDQPVVGLVEVVGSTEATEALAVTLGTVRAAQKAGWIAFACGGARITCVETGESWIIKLVEPKP